MDKRWVGAVAIALVVGGAGGAWYWNKSQASPITYTTAPVDKGHIAAKVTASGTLSALVTVTIGSQVSGRIQQLMADFNSQVKKGQVLATLDPQLLDAAVTQARANDMAAVSNLIRNRALALNGQQQLRRARTLAARQLIAQADLDTAQANADAANAQVLSAQASVAQARAQLHQAQVNLAYATIRSPIDGVVISRSVDVGQTVAASLQAPTLFVIAQDLKKAQVDASVSESDVGKLAPGQAAEFTVSAFPNEKFKGKVRQIRNAPITTQNVVTYHAVIDVTNPELKLRPGMTANVTFTYAENDEALRVPNAALRFKPPVDPDAKPSPGASASPGSGMGGRRFGGGQGRGRGSASNRKMVYVLKEGKPVPVRVRTGLTDGSFTEIVRGELKEGDAVITDATGGESESANQQRPSGTALGGGGQRRVRGL